MKKIAVLFLVAGLLLAVCPQSSEAGGRWHRGHHGHGGRWVGPFVAGVIAGAVVAPRVYYCSPPIVYTPPPVVVQYAPPDATVRCGGCSKVFPWYGNGMPPAPPCGCGVDYNVWR